MSRPGRPIAECMCALATLIHALIWVAAALIALAFYFSFLFFISAVLPGRPSRCQGGLNSPELALRHPLLKEKSHD